MFISIIQDKYIIRAMVVSYNPFFVKNKLIEMTKEKPKNRREKRVCIIIKIWPNFSSPLQRLSQSLLHL